MMFKIVHDAQDLCLRVQAPNQAVFNRLKFVVANNFFARRLKSSL